MDPRYTILKTDSGICLVAVWTPDPVQTAYSGRRWLRQTVDLEFASWQSAAGWIRAGGLSEVTVTINEKPLAVAA